jgi:2-desacetyl-2-hydroxyethyl bacteriochlorophyllide A dehydrogenase
LKRISLYFVAPQRVELREEELSAPGASEVGVKTICSAISVGTEMMLYRGEAPSDMPADASLPALRGSLAYPLKYGYCAVGRVAAVGNGVDESWMGRRVFAFNPHESAFNARVEDVQPLPTAIADEEAVFLPHMETAVNLILDGDPRMGEKIAVLGQGVVGLLTTALLDRHPLEALLTFDRFTLRREFAARFGVKHSFDPDAGSKEVSRLFGAGRADMVYELSGHPEALDLALLLVGENGRIVVGSWYGQRRAAVNLGGHFHRGRIKLISSQVSHIEPALTGRWDRVRRFEQAWKMLVEIQPSQLVTHRFPFEQAGQAYAQLAAKPAETVGVLFNY